MFLESDKVCFNWLLIGLSLGDFDLIPGDLHFDPLESTLLEWLRISFKLGL